MEKGSYPRERVSPSLKDAENSPMYGSYSLVGQDSLLPLSVFGQVLIPGDFSSVGGSDDVEDSVDHRPCCMVDMNGK